MAKRILVVEHDEATLEALGLAFQRAGLEPVAAPDAATALVRFREHTPAAVLIAVGPGNDTTTLVADLRKERDGAIIPVLFMGEAQPDDVIRSPSDALAVGGDYFFKLPTDLDYLAGRVLGWTGESPSTHSARLDATPLDLGPIPFAEVTDEVTELTAPIPISEPARRPPGPIPGEPVDDGPTAGLGERHPNPRRPTVTTPKEREALEMVKEGERLRTQGLPDAAIAAYAAAAEVYEGEERIDPALALHKLILHLDPQKLELARHAADLARAHGKTKDAIEILRRPAKALEAAERFEEAAGVVRTLIELSPADPALVLKLASLESKARDAARPISRPSHAPLAPLAPPPAEVATPRSSSGPGHDDWDAALARELALSEEALLPPPPPAKLAVIPAESNAGQPWTPEVVAPAEGALAFPERTDAAGWEDDVASIEELTPEEAASAFAPKPLPGLNAPGPAAPGPAPRRRSSRDRLRPRGAEEPGPAEGAELEAETAKPEAPAPLRFPDATPASGAPLGALDGLELPAPVGARGPRPPSSKRPLEPRVPPALEIVGGVTADPGLGPVLERADPLPTGGVVGGLTRDERRSDSNPARSPSEPARGGLTRDERSGRRLDDLRWDDALAEPAEPPPLDLEDLLDRDALDEVLAELSPPQEEPAAPVEPPRIKEPRGSDRPTPRSRRPAPSPEAKGGRAPRSPAEPEAHVRGVEPAKLADDVPKAGPKPEASANEVRPRRRTGSGGATSPAARRPSGPAPGSSNPPEAQVGPTPPHADAKEPSGVGATVAAISTHATIEEPSPVPPKSAPLPWSAAGPWPSASTNPEPGPSAESESADLSLERHSTEPKESTTRPGAAAEAGDPRAPATADDRAGAASASKATREAPSAEAPRSHPDPEPKAQAPSSASAVPPAAQAEPAPASPEDVAEGASGAADRLTSPRAAAPKSLASEPPRAGTAPNRTDAAALGPSPQAASTEGPAATPPTTLDPARPSAHPGDTPGASDSPSSLPRPAAQPTGVAPADATPAPLHLGPKRAVDPAHPRPAAQPADAARADSTPAPLHLGPKTAVDPPLPRPAAQPADAAPADSTPTPLHLGPKTAVDPALPGGLEPPAGAAPAASTPTALHVGPKAAVDPALPRPAVPPAGTAPADSTPAPLHLGPKTAIDPALPRPAAPPAEAAPAASTPTPLHLGPKTAVDPALPDGLEPRTGAAPAASTPTPLHLGPKTAIDPSAVPVPQAAPFAAAGAAPVVSSASGAHSALVDPSSSGTTSAPGPAWATSSSSTPRSPDEPAAATDATGKSSLGPRPALPQGSTPAPPTERVTEPAPPPELLLDQEPAASGLLPPPPAVLEADAPRIEPTLELGPASAPLRPSEWTSVTAALVSAQPAAWDGVAAPEAKTDPANPAPPPRGPLEVGPPIRLRALVPAQGHLRSLADAITLFAQLKAQRSTGLLHAEGLATYVMVHGEPAALRGELALDTLLVLLEPRLLAATPIPRPDDRPVILGRDLVQRGKLRERECFAYLHHHLELGVLALLRHRGPFAFQTEEVQLEREELVPEPTPAFELLADLLPWVVPGTELLHGLGGPDARLRAAGSPGNLSGRDARFAALLDGQHRLEDGARLAMISLERAAALGTLLVGFGRATVVPAKIARPLGSARPEPAWMPLGLGAPMPTAPTPLGPVEAPSTPLPPAPVPHAPLRSLEPKARLVALAELVRTSDYFTILGVDHAASKVNIDQAHHHLRSLVAGLEHGEDPDSRRMAVEVLRSLDEARDVLRTPELRAAYLRHLRP